MSDYKFLTVPQPENVDHVYYVIPLVISDISSKLDRNWLISALHAEGLKNVYGGFANIHRCLTLSGITQQTVFTNCGKNASE